MNCNNLPQLLFPISFISFNHKNQRHLRSIMLIEINNETKTVNENFSATEIFSLLEIKNTNGYALAINDNVIPKSKWSETILKENDKVLVIQATQGG
jgi:sulfur carrier protein